MVTTSRKGGDDITFIFDQNISSDTVDKPFKVVYVSKSFTEDTEAGRFSNIQDAIDWIHDESGWDLTSSSQPSYVYIYPGRYYNQITCYPNIRLYGLKGSTFDYSTVTIRSGGETRDDYPLAPGPDYQYFLSGIDIKCTGDNGIITELGDCLFEDCILYEGKFAENTTEDIYVNMQFKNVTMWPDADGMIFNVTGVRTGERYIKFDRCRLAGDMIFSSTHATELAYIEWNTTTLSGNHFELKGDWDIDLRDSYVYDNIDGTRNILDTTGFWRFYNSNISNGFHVVKDTTEDKVFHNLDFNDPDGIAITGADITADETITNIDYSNNVQQNGLSGEIQILDNIKNVGGNSTNRYITIQDAIDSVITTGILKLGETYTGLSELTISNNKTILIDGSNTYSLSFTSDIVELGLNEVLTFSGLRDFDGDLIEINGNGAEIHIHDCNHSSVFGILITSGTGAHVHIVNTNYSAPTGHSAIQYNSIDPTCLIEYSRLKGAAGEPAIEFTVVADDVLQGKFSTFIHGDEGFSEPLNNTTTTIYLSLYLCAGNDDIVPTGFVNRIGGSGIIADPQIIY